MLEYEWGNPSAMMLSVEEPNGEPDPNRQIFDGHYATAATTTAATQPSLNETLFLHPNNTAFPHQNHPFHNPNQAQQPHAHLHSLYDPRSYSGGVSAYSTLSIDPLPGTMGSGGGYFLVPKSEEVSTPVDFGASRIGLNLGGRTYFSSAEDEFVNRLYRRSRTGDPGSIINIPRCQAEACTADLTHAKHYHRRHKVCEFHSKASTVYANGLTQRFCQQCSRFHLLSEFDNGKRSCRKRLADHNRRRRKSQVQQQQQQPNNGGNSSSDNPPTPRSPPDSRVLSFSSSVTMTVSPPRSSLDGFGKRPYNPTASSSSSSSRTTYFSSN